MLLLRPSSAGLLGAVVLWAVACAPAAPMTSWVIEDVGGVGIDLYDRPGGRVVETLRVPGGPRVTPVGVRGEHWEVLTASGRSAWLDPAEFPVPELGGAFVAQYQIHVATAFAFADEAREPLLAIQVDTLAPRRQLDSAPMRLTVERIWSRYRPFTAGVQRVSIMVLSADTDEAAPMRSRQGDILGYRRLATRLCTHRIDEDLWSPLGPCRSTQWLGQPGYNRWPTPEVSPQ